MSALAVLYLAAMVLPQAQANPLQAELENALDVGKIGSVKVRDLRLVNSAHRTSMILFGTLTPKKDWEKTLEKDGFKRHAEWTFAKQVAKGGHFELEVMNNGVHKELRISLEYPSTNTEHKQFDFGPVALGSTLYSVLPQQGSTFVLIPPTYNWASMRLPDLQGMRAIKGESGMRYQETTGWYIFCLLHKEGAKKASVDVPTLPHLRIGMDRVEV